MNNGVDGQLLPLYVLIIKICLYVRSFKSGDDMHCSAFCKSNSCRKEIYGYIFPKDFLAKGVSKYNGTHSPFVYYISKLVNRTEIVDKEKEYDGHETGTNGWVHATTTNGADGLRRFVTYCSMTACSLHRGYIIMQVT